MNRNRCNAYSHSLDTHEMHIHMYTQYFLRTGCDFVSTRACILVGFFQEVPHTGGFNKLIMRRFEVLCPSHHKYLDPCSHCVWRLTRTVALFPSHCVVYIAHTVLLTSVLLLPSLSLAQCTRSTLFISSRTSQRNLFLWITPRSHNVFFIVVGVYLALWRTNLSLAQFRVPRSHCIVILRNTSLQYCPSQHFNNVYMNTYVYSVTPATAQDYNPVYTRVCIHTLFSCQVCFKESRLLAFYQDDSSA